MRRRYREKERETEREKRKKERPRKRVNEGWRKKRERQRKKERHRKRERERGERMLSSMQRAGYIMLPLAPALTLSNLPVVAERRDVGMRAAKQEECLECESMPSGSEECSADVTAHPYYVLTILTVVFLRVDIEYLLPKFEKHVFSESIILSWTHERQNHWAFNSFFACMQ